VRTRSWSPGKCTTEWLLLLLHDPDGYEVCFHMLRHHTELDPGHTLSVHDARIGPVGANQEDSAAVPDPIGLARS
jgi:hypothetical protein